MNGRMFACMCCVIMCSFAIFYCDDVWLEFVAVIVLQVTTMKYKEQAMKKGPLFRAS